MLDKKNPEGYIFSLFLRASLGMHSIERYLHLNEEKGKNGVGFCKEDEKCKSSLLSNESAGA